MEDKSAVDSDDGLNPKASSFVPSFLQLGHQVQQIEEKTKPLNAPYLISSSQSSSDNKEDLNPKASSFVPSFLQLGHQVQQIEEKTKPLNAPSYLSFSLDFSQQSSSDDKEDLNLKVSSCVQQLEEIKIEKMYGMDSMQKIRHMTENKKKKAEKSSLAGSNTKIILRELGCEYDSEIALNKILEGALRCIDYSSSVAIVGSFALFCYERNVLGNRPVWKPDDCDIFVCIKSYNDFLQFVSDFQNEVNDRLESANIPLILERFDRYPFASADAVIPDLTKGGVDCISVKLLRTRTLIINELRDDISTVRLYFFHG